ncbi:MAG TPA: hypothetical protein VG294_02660 [Solirubrobacteraceae bacterium]|nr:hypothetical protein [Solirubrobacteraceae bacterium]
MTFAKSGQVLEDGIDGIRMETVLSRSFSDAVWSGRGELAGVEADRVWAGSPRRLRLLGPGRAPSWSPNGAELAIVRAARRDADRIGNVALLSIPSHVARRIACRWLHGVTGTRGPLRARGRA